MAAEPTSVDTATGLLLAAHEELRRAGLTERFLELAVDTADNRSGAFFGSFGDERGCFLQFQTSETPGEVVMRFGLRRKFGWFRRVFEILREGWSAFRNKDTEYEVHLKPADVGRLKDMLRFLERRHELASESD